MWRRWGLVVVIMVLAGACGGLSASQGASVGAVATASPGTVSVAPTTPSPTAVRLSGDYDLGDGRHLHLECLGSGSPTIVIDVGNDDTIHGSWDAVFTPMAQISQVCAYDRANLGKSDPNPGPRTISDLGEDLLTLLNVAGIDGPYVFVGGSFGGNITGVLAAEHPEAVAGLVLADSEPANVDPALDPLRANLTPAQYKACCEDPGLPAFDDPENREHIDFAAGQAAELASVTHLPRVPTEVLTATRIDCQADWPCDAILTSEERLQARWIEGNPLGRQTSVKSGHVMQREAPTAIVDAARRVAEAVRAGGAEPAAS
jgi:pimeloyl-ACP methyl ester carboxylesterase